MIIARFSTAKLALFFGGVVLLAVATSVVLAMGWTRSSLRATAWLVVLPLIILVALRTAWSIWRWKRPAIEIADGALRAWGLSRPIPVADIADVQISASRTDVETWIGVVVYRDAGSPARLPTIFLHGERRAIATALRRALGLSDAGLRR